MEVTIEYAPAKRGFKDKIASRATMWRKVFQGKMPFFLAVYLTIPVAIRPDFLRQRKSRVAFLGRPFLIPFGEYIVYVVCKEQIVDCNQYHIELIKDGDVVVDAGANMGIFSCFVASKYPHAEIFAFEPSVGVLKSLRPNSAPYPNIKIMPVALGDKQGTVSLVTLPEAPASNHIGVGGDPVEMRTIDSYTMRMNFLKIDSEGYEAEILEGARQTIKKWKPVVVMSAYHKPNDKTDLPALLNSIAPYRCELRYDSEEDLICVPT